MKLYLKILLNILTLSTFCSSLEKSNIRNRYKKNILNKSNENNRSNPPPIQKNFTNEKNISDQANTPENAHAIPEAEKENNYKVGIIII